MRWLIDARPLIDARQGGVSRVARELTAALARTGDDLILFTTGQAQPTQEQLIHGPNIHPLHISIPNKLWSTGVFLHTTSIDREVQRRPERANALFLPNIGFTGIPRLPYAVLVHDLSFLIEPHWFSMRMRLWHRAVGAATLLRSASHLVCVSHATQQDCIRLLGIPATRTSVINLGPIPLGITEPIAPNLALREPFLLALDGDTPRKNISTAIAAVEHLRQRPQWSTLTLVIIGSSKQLTRLAKKHPWIQLLHRVADAELAWLYSHATAFLYPSWYEGFGLPLHEAARFGTPRIASFTSALPETAPPNTLFADPAKPHHWTTALQIALTSPRPAPHPQAHSLWDAAGKTVREILLRISNA